MKVLNIACDDWCNFAYDNMMSLRSVGVDCRLLKRNKDPFARVAEGEIATFDEMRQAIGQSDVVQIFFSHIQLTRTLISSLRGKRVIVYHAGSYYRDNTAECNAVFNPIVEKSIIALGEFEGLGAKNAVYIAPAIDTERISQSSKPIGTPYVIGHYPSNTEVKGTDAINSTMSWLGKSHKFIYNHSAESVPADEQIRRMSECDIYVELLKPELNGRKYGSWGITALEAACLGKIVVTQNLSNDLYESQYGKCPFLLVKDQVGLAEIVDSILRSTQGWMEVMQASTRLWVVRNHSYKATGERIWRTIAAD
jgi:hypothetical protein